MEDHDMGPGMSGPPQSQAPPVPAEPATPLQAAVDVHMKIFNAMRSKELKPELKKRGIEVEGDRVEALQQLAERIKAELVHAVQLDPSTVDTRLAERGKMELTLLNPYARLEDDTAVAEGRPEEAAEDAVPSLYDSKQPDGTRRRVLDNFVFCDQYGRMHPLEVLDLHTVELYGFGTVVEQRPGAKSSLQQPVGRPAVSGSGKGSSFLEPTPVGSTSREEAHKRAAQMLEASTFPIKVGSVTVHELGEIKCGPHDAAYHNDKYLWPVGFRSTREYSSYLDPNERVEYTSEILDGGVDGPIFRVTASDDADHPLEAKASSAVWQQVMKKVTTAKEALRQPTRAGVSVSGPEFYGYSQPRIARLMEGLPNALSCRAYVMREHRGGKILDVPRKRKPSARVAKPPPPPKRPRFSKLEQIIRDILAGMDAQVISLKKVRLAAEKKVGKSLGDKKDEIKQAVKEYMAEQSGETLPSDGEGGGDGAAAEPAAKQARTRKPSDADGDADADAEADAADVDPEADAEPASNEPEAEAGNNAEGEEEADDAAADSDGDGDGAAAGGAAGAAADVPAVKSEPSGPPQRMRIKLGPIREWRVDHRYDMPTLWAVTDTAWYRVDGTTDVTPAPVYRYMFESAQHKFRASIAVARVLIDLLPGNKSLAYRAVVAEVDERTKTERVPITETFMIENARFLAEQVSSLDTPETKGLYANCKFVETVLKRGDNFEKRMTTIREREAAREARERQKALQDATKRHRAPAEPAVKEVFEDMDVVAEDAEKGVQRPERPEAGPVVQGCSDTVGAELVRCWWFLRSFREQLGLEEFSFDSLVDALRLTEHSCTLVTEIHVALLTLLHAERAELFFPSGTVGELKPVTAYAYKQNPLLHPTLLLAGILSVTRKDSLHTVWPEVLRPLLIYHLPSAQFARLKAIAEEPAGPDVPLEGQTASFGKGPIAFQHSKLAGQWGPVMTACSSVMEELMEKDACKSWFNTPVDTSSPELAEYETVITEPMDLGTIRMRLDTGYYSVPPTAEEASLPTVGALRGTGHKGWANDVRLVFSNCMTFNDKASELAKIAEGLLGEFDTAYREKVLVAVSMNMERPGATDLEALGYREHWPGADGPQGGLLAPVLGLTYHDYRVLPIDQKVEILRFLCDAAAECASCRKHTDDAVEACVPVRTNLRKVELDERRRVRNHGRMPRRRRRGPKKPKKAAKAPKAEGSEGASDDEDEEEDEDEDEEDSTDEDSDEVSDEEEDEEDAEDDAGGEDDEDAATSKPIGRIRIALGGARVAAGDGGAAEEKSGGTVVRLSNGGSAAAAASAEAAALDEHEAKLWTLRNEVVDLAMRMTLIGEDRFFNRYSLLGTNQPKGLARLLVEDAHTGQMRAYHSHDSLEALQRWLHPRGQRESRLAYKIETWLPGLTVQTNARRDMVRACATARAALGASATTARQELHCAHLQSAVLKHAMRPASAFLTFPATIRFLDSQLSSEAAGRGWAGTAAQGRVHELLEQLVEAPQYDGQALASTGMLDGDAINYDPNLAVLEASVAAADTVAVAARELLLILEQAIMESMPELMATGVVKEQWRGLRATWRYLVSKATTLAQVSLWLHVLQADGLVLTVLTKAGATSQQRADWLRNVREQERAFIPGLGEDVVFFGEAYAAMCAAARQSKRPRGFARLLSESDSNPNFVSYCRVSRITYEIADDGTPYSRISLQVTQRYATGVFDAAAIREAKDGEPVVVMDSFPALVFDWTGFNAGSRVQVTAHDRFSAIIRWALDAMKSHPDAESFLHPVDTSVYSDYLAVVQQPLCIKDMEAKLAANAYHTLDAVRADMKLIVVNCTAYCSSRFPQLIPAAKAVADMGLSLLTSYESVLVKLTEVMTTGQEFGAGAQSSAPREEVLRRFEQAVAANPRTDAFVRMVVERARAHFGRSTPEGSYQQVLAHTLAYARAECTFMQGQACENGVGSTCVRVGLTSDLPGVTPSSVTICVPVSNAFATPADTLHTPPAAEASFNILVPLAPVGGVECLVPRKLYAEHLLTPWMGGQRVQSRVRGQESATGIVVGCRNTGVRGVMPWRSVIVRWDAAARGKEISTANPWELAGRRPVGLR